MNAYIVSNPNSYLKIKKYLEKLNFFSLINFYSEDIEDKKENFIIFCENSEKEVIESIKNKYIFSPILILFEKEINEYLYEYMFDEYLYLTESIEKSKIKINNLFLKKKFEIASNHIFEAEKLLLSKERINLIQKIEEDKFLFINFLVGILEVIYESKYKNLSFHAHNVGHLSGILAEEEGLKARQVTYIEWAGFFHDLYIIFSEDKSKSMLDHIKFSNKKKDLTVLFEINKNIFENDIYDILIDFFSNNLVKMNKLSKFIQYSEIIDLKVFDLINKNYKLSSNDVDKQLKDLIKNIPFEDIKSTFEKSKKRILSYYSKIVRNLNS
ncbi:hypothetical protein OSSY52_21670 [Tepiditoga spiralis]|uniref:HD domain-containing protein n=1 Tax=Tepiditoga spiralis TaxID=2108365 RepID=A0A7G1G982_9BACT|nr:HD domain-containing protein [Tepiditoga spiralis]BBE32026.1 hypothetical protein OSSY52_21670 [Tepiditoga spiralis]